MMHDLRLALRRLRRELALTAAVIAIVGLAIAANTALFSVFDGLLFRPLPFPNADRVVHVELPRTSQQALSRDEVRERRQRLDTTPLLQARVSLNRDAYRLEKGTAGPLAWGLKAASVTPELFRLLGVQPMLGQVFTDEKQDVGAFVAAAYTASGDLMVTAPPDAMEVPGTVMLGYELWRDRYGADVSLIGQSIEIPGMFLGRRPTLVGVLPPGFDFPSGTNLWFPSRRTAALFSFGWLADGATIEQLRAENPGFVFMPLREYLRPQGAFAIGLLLGATGLLLLAAWAQVAALMLARAAGRAREIGTQLALGISRARLARQFIVEALVVASAALVVGWIAATPVTAGVVRLLPEEMTLGQTLMPDVRAAAFASLLSVCGVVLLALVPLNIARRCEPSRLLRGSMFSVVGNAARTRSVLLAVQFGVTTVLIFLCGLSARSFVNIASVDLGFTPDRIVGFRMPGLNLTIGDQGSGWAEQMDRRAAQAEETMAALWALPTVSHVAGGPIPFDEDAVAGQSVEVASSATQPGTSATLFSVTAGYMDVLGLRPLEGQIPTEQEVEQTANPLVIVNEALQRAVAVSTPLVGSLIDIKGERMRVVAVVSDARLADPEQPTRPHLFQMVPTSSALGFVVVRAMEGESLDGVAAAIQTRLSTLWPEASPREIVSGADLTAAATVDYRARAVLLALIGVACLPLAIVGVMGSVRYSTQQRARELCIRLAIGATVEQVRRDVIWKALWPTLLGLLGGLGVSLIVARLLMSFLFGVAPADPMTIAAVLVMLTGTAWMAAAMAARRVGRVSVAAVLRD